MLVETNESQSLYHAQNLLDLVEYLEATPRRWVQRASEQAGDARRGQGWDLGADYPASLRMAKHGWDDGVRRIQSLLSKVPTQARAVQHFGIAGDSPDIGRYLSGNPMCMVRRVRVQKEKPTVTIACNMVAAAGITAESIANFGAAICVLADRLEGQGIRCELIGCIAVEGMGGHRMVLSWQIKNPEDPLDLAAVAFSFGHPAMLRRLCFALLERMSRKWETEGYGYVSKATYLDIPGAPPHTVVINGVGANLGRCMTLAGAIDFAKDEINKGALKAGGTEIAELEAV